VAHVSGRAALWEPLHRLLAYFQGDVPEILRVSIAMLGDPVRNAANVTDDLDRLIGNLDPHTDPVGAMRVAVACFYVDRIAACRHALRNLLQLAREGGIHGIAISTLNLLTYDALMSGQWSELREYADEADALCLLHSNLFNTWSGRYIRALFCAVTGDYDTAIAIAEAIMQWALPRGAFSPQWYALHVRTVVALGEGDYEEALRNASAITPPGTLPPYVCYALSIPLDLVEASVAAGHFEAASAHATVLRNAGVANISPRLGMLVSACEAMVAPAELAPTLFRAALGLPGTEMWPFERARVQLLYGEYLRRIGWTAEARPELAAACEVFEQLRAVPWASRASNELRAAGQTRLRTQEREWVSLTSQQREIALLAASGLTNKEIGEKLYLSHRTVAGHLHRIFPILGISTRAALRDALSDLSETGSSEMGTRAF
jgi:DNA-binding CsgD family transcriptional regulator